jgi:hypothetical protein
LHERVFKAFPREWDLAALRQRMPHAMKHTVNFIITLFGANVQKR